MKFFFLRCNINCFVFNENSRLCTQNDPSSPMNLQVPQNPQKSKPGFSRKTQKFRTVTFSNAVEERSIDIDQPSSSRSHFFFDKVNNDDNTQKKEDLPDENKNTQPEQTETENVETPPEPEKYRGKNAFLYNYLQDFLNFTLGQDDDEDVHHRIEEESHLKKELTEIPQLFRQHTKITNKRRPDFLQVTHMNKIEKVYVDYDVFPDKYPFNRTRKFFMLVYRYVEVYSQKFLKSTLFEILSLIVILMNCVTYILKQNRRGEYSTYYDEINRFETCFLVFYIIEMSLKMTAFGLILQRSSYFREGWNILDFFVILNLILLNYNVTAGIIKDYSLLRIIRLLRPLRALTKFKKLRTIISSLFSAVPLLLDFLAILLFFFLIYAAVGLHLFAGLLVYRCYDLPTGKITSPETVCGNLECPTNSLCIRGLDNIEGGVINFDNLLSSMLQVILISTLDNWTVTMYNIEKALTNYAWIYFVSLVILGNYILLNLTLALIKVKFSENHNLIQNEKIAFNKSVITYDFMDIKRQGLWISKRKEDPIEVRASDMKAKNSNQLSESHIPNENDGSKTNFNVEEKVIKLFKDMVPMSLKNQDSKLNPRQSILKKPSTSFATMQVDKRRRGGNIKPSSLSSKSKTFKSFKSHSSSMMTKKNKKDPKITPLGSHLKNSKIEQVYSSESLLSFISMDNNNRSKIIRSKISNRFLRCLLKIFGRVVKIIPYRKYMKHQTIFHLEPKYLKLLVNFEREYKSSSEEDILPNKDEIQKTKLIKEQMSLINRKKLPIIYTPKKKKASLLKFLRQVYSKKFGSSTTKGQSNTANNRGKEVLLLSSHSESSFTSLEDKFFKNFSVKKGIAVKPTKRFSREKQLTNLSINTDKIAIELENYVVNLNDLFRAKDENVSKDKIHGRNDEKIRKKLENLLSPSHRKTGEQLSETNNYVWMRNLINQNIEEEKDDDKESIEKENLQSVDMAKKYLEIRVRI